VPAVKPLGALVTSTGCASKHIGWLHELDLMTVETADELNAVNDPVFRAMMASRS